MGKKANKIEKTCNDCVYYPACQMWHIGVITKMEACAQFLSWRDFYRLYPNPYVKAGVKND